MAKTRENANSGDRHAQYELARAYDAGNGVNKNKVKAFNWRLKDANHRRPHAQYFLAFIYFPWWPGRGE
ncbi:MAG: hypothetical protein LBT86_02540 [Deltaproteobacteria bacterium]|nr:hypothetical protein [Deltaproteobacteria bacterium]